MASFPGASVFYPTPAYSQQEQQHQQQQQHIYMQQQQHQPPHQQMHHYHQLPQQHFPSSAQYPMHHGLTFMAHSSPMSTSSSSSHAMPVGLGVPTSFHPFDRQNVTLQAGYPAIEQQQHMAASIRQMSASPNSGHSGELEQQPRRAGAPRPGSALSADGPDRVGPGNEEQGQQGGDDADAGQDGDDAGTGTGASGPSAASAADRETFGIVDEESTSLWDLADGPDGYTGKPPYPYLTLIRIALLCSEHKRLTLQELYDALEARYPFFNGEQKGWKNSIRHNLSLNKCFKKEARHVLDPGKGSYWYVDINEEYSTPRVRHRRKRDKDSGSPSPPVARGKKRKQSPIEASAGLSHREAKGARPADIRLPAPGLAPPVITRSNRFRAISAPSPSTASFFFGDTFPPFGPAAGQPFQQSFLPSHPFQGGYVYGAPPIHAQQQQAYAFPAPPAVHHPMDLQPWRPVLGGATAVDYRPVTAGEDVKPNLHPYRPSEVEDLTGDDGDEIQQLGQPRGSVGEIHVKEEPLELSIPAMVPDTGTSMPDTGSTLGQPATPRSIFGGMLEKNLASAATGANPSDAVKSPPPGPVASYSFPHPAGPATFPGQRIMVAPPGMVQAAGIRPAPLHFVHRDLRRAYSPPISAGMAQSPTRLLPSKDYDTLFSNAPFGMIFGDAPQKRASRSGSIFGLVR